MAACIEDVGIPSDLWFHMMPNTVLVSIPIVMDKKSGRLQSVVAIQLLPARPPPSLTHTLSLSHIHTTLTHT